MKPKPLSILSLITEELLEVAKTWILKARKHFPHHESDWDVCFHWEAEKKLILNLLMKGEYPFQPVKIIRKQSGGTTWLWHARDAIVLKALAISMAPYCNISVDCTHTKGHGGITRLSKLTDKACRDNHFAFKSDIKDFYQSINHEFLVAKLKALGFEACVIQLIQCFLNHAEEYGGLYSEMTVGISKACPLSPLLGALYLSELDEAMGKLNVFYIRFMDDWLIFAKKRWHLRKAIKICNQILNRLELNKHPYKTLIGYIKKGFDYCGFKYNHQGIIHLANKTLKQYQQKLAKLYEQPGKLLRYQINLIAWLKGNGSGGNGQTTVMDTVLLAVMPEIHRALDAALRYSI